MNELRAYLANRRKELSAELSEAKNQAQADVIFARIVEVIAMQCQMELLP